MSTLFTGVEIDVVHCIFQGIFEEILNCPHKHKCKLGIKAANQHLSCLPLFLGLTCVMSYFCNPQGHVICRISVIHSAVCYVVFL